MGCGSYQLPHFVLGSWLHSLNYIRSVCAHHARLWNRECRIKPIIANAFRADLTPNDRIYAQLVVKQILLNRIAPGNHREFDWGQAQQHSSLCKQPGPRQGKPRKIRRFLDGFFRLIRVCPESL